MTAKADPWAQLRLLELQGLDTRLDQIAHRLRSLPEHAQIAAADEVLAGLADRAVAARTEVSDVERLVRKAEADVDQVRTRAAKDQQLLDSGAITSAKQLEELQHEVVSLARRQSDLEDAELEVMERLEEVQATARAIDQEHTTATSARAAAVEGRDAASAQLDAEAGDVRAQRAEVVTAIPDELLALYEKLRADHGGVGAARLHRGRCDGCHMELNPTDIGRIRAAADDEVLRCEECRRILVRTAESGL